MLATSAHNTLRELRLVRPSLSSELRAKFEEDLRNSRFAEPDFMVATPESPARVPKSWQLSELERWRQSNPVYLEHLACLIVWTARLSQLHSPLMLSPLQNPQAQMFGALNYRGLFHHEQPAEGLKSTAIDPIRYAKAATWTNQIYGFHQVCRTFFKAPIKGAWNQFYVKNRNTYYGFPALDAWVNYQISSGDLNSQWHSQIENGTYSEDEKTRLRTFSLVQMNAKTPLLGVNHRFISELHTSSLAPEFTKFRADFIDAPIAITLYGREVFMNLCFSVESPSSIILMQKQVNTKTKGKAFEVANLNWASPVIETLIPIFKKALPRLNTIKVLSAENCVWHKAHPDLPELKKSLRKQYDLWAISNYKCQPDENGNLAFSV